MSKFWLCAIAFFVSIGCVDAACLAVAIPRAQVEDKGGKWIKLTHDQYEFMRGVYVLNPTTPPGLPPGDVIYLATIPGNDIGVAFFTDGDEACWPMQVTKPLLDLLDKVATGEVVHAGEGM